MIFKKISTQLNIFAQCKKYRIPLWQCPQFLFLIMGVIIIVSIFTAYIVATQYVAEPRIVALIVLLLAIILFIIAVIITKSFERLAEASMMKSEFISIVSHQLRSPLSNLNWAIEFLFSGRLGRIEEKQLEYFEILKENSAKMGELIKGLLVVARIETGDFPLKKEIFSLGEMTKDLVLKFKPFVRAVNTEIKIKVQPNLSLAFADPYQVKLVMENLLDNAIRYTDLSKRNNIPHSSKEKNRINIKLVQNKNNFYFEIKDSGTGIPERDQKHIFQKFFRSENILRHQINGSGLGLYIAKSIIVKSGGKIGFKSEENKGSTFWFTLPC